MADKEADSSYHHEANSVTGFNMERSSILEFERIEKECMNVNISLAEQPSGELEHEISKDIVVPSSLLNRVE